MDPDSTSIETPDSDPLDAERTRIFFQWLHAREEDGYEGNLDGVFGWWVLLPTHDPPGVVSCARIACSRIFLRPHLFVQSLQRICIRTLMLCFLRTTISMTAPSPSSRYEVV